MKNNKSVRVIIDKFSKFATSQFIMGLILGALTSFLVNYYTIAYEDHQRTNEYIGSLMYELDYNLDRIDGGENNDSVYIALFREDAWQSGFSSGMLYDLSEKTAHSLQDTYSEISRINEQRLVNDQSFSLLNYEAYESIGRLDYYEKQISGSSNKSGLEEKIAHYMEESEALIHAKDNTSAELVRSANDVNNGLKTSLEKTRKHLKKEREDMGNFFFNMFRSMGAFIIIVVSIIMVIFVVFSFLKRK